MTSAVQISGKLRRELEKYLETPLKFRETGVINSVNR